MVRRQRRVLARQNGSKWRGRVALFARIALCSNGVNVVSRSGSARTTRIAAEIWGPPRRSTHAKSPNIVRSFGSELEKNRRSAARDHADAGNVTQVRSLVQPINGAGRRARGGRPVCLAQFITAMSASMDLQHITNGSPRSACGRRLDHGARPTRTSTWGSARRPVSVRIISRLACSSIMWVSVQVAKPAAVHSSSTRERTSPHCNVFR